MRLEHEWIKYIDELESINEVAEGYLKDYIQRHGIDEENREELIKVINALIVRYGEASGASACKMYDKIALKQNAEVDAAEPSDLAKYGEVAKAVNGAIKQSSNGKLLPQILHRFIKQSSTDTMLKNATRDHASFAWVPGGGDTCSYCLVLAGTGWHKAGKNTLQGKYAGHIHANCKCTYAVDFNGTLKIEGYNPEEYDQMVRDCFGEDFGAEELLNSTWNNKKGKADYKSLNKFRNYLDQRRKVEEFLRTFNPVDESIVVNVARKEHENWIRQLSDPARKLIERYTYNPGDNNPQFYERINSFIREGVSGSNKDYSEQVDIISNALKQSKLSSDYICFRGSDYNPFDGKNIGESGKAGQFFSTSVIRTRAFKGKYAFFIYAPKGTNAAYVEKLSKKFEKQREMLFDKDVVYEVMYKKGNNIFLRAKI